MKVSPKILKIVKAKTSTDSMFFNLLTEHQTKYQGAQIGKKTCLIKVKIWKSSNTRQDSKLDQTWISNQYQQ
jgi:hypothetical protein